MKKKSFTSIFVAGLVLYLIISIIGQQISIVRISKEKKEVTSQIEALKKENDKLNDDIKASQNKDYMEKLARQRLDLIKKGEVPVVQN